MPSSPFSLSVSVRSVDNYLIDVHVERCRCEVDWHAQNTVIEDITTTKEHPFPISSWNLFGLYVDIPAGTQLNLPRYENDFRGALEPTGVGPKYSNLP